ncbi:hypothetical protein KC363_g5408 [Hortaea werneckii]|uniref:White collar 1 protein n=1 Tax=Hortaea werneckii TaxID=91943 RepID=A0A3M7FIR0_HORWE|nr:hypothetical protein KC363_g5408 [Hortaea werneckii]RMY88652.1 hypothetical protein D0861_04714 [Hortaea werneckii]
MNGYSYDGGFNADDVGQNAQYGMPDPMMMAEDGMGGNGVGGDGMGGDGMGGDGMAGDLVGGQSLDEILNGNAKSSRRQSLPRQYPQNMRRMSSDMRSMSMMNFGAGSPAGPMGDYFEPSAGSSMMPDASSNNAQQRVPQKTSHSANVSRRQSAENGLALNTNFGNTSQTFGNMMGSNSAFASPHASGGMGMGMASPYVDSNMGMSVEGLGGQMMDDPMSMNAYNQPQFSTSAMASPMHPGAQQNAPTSGGRAPPNDVAARGGNTPFGSNVLNSGGNSVRNALSRSHSLHLNDGQSPAAQATTPMSQPGPAPVPQPPMNQGFRGQPQYPAPGSRQDVGMANSNFNGVNGPLPVNAANYNPNNQGFPWEAPEGGWPSTMVNKPHMQSSYKNAYSSTGFDMLGVLMRVATRPNPEINIGSVDLSCAFVVCDAEKDDIPIVYCSDNFERLTGYTKHMILGRNCRFLQSPDGNVEPGVRRKYVDDDSVLYLKNMINLRREAQISLINYRRGGQPFMNLLTMIPITWDTEQVKFFVGFQVDLVEQPNAVTNKNPDGSYSINYQRAMTMPRYIVNPAPETQQNKSELGQTVPRDDVSAILATFGSGESEYAKRMWDKVLLENTDDVIHVLSLKGLFQWISPSAAKVLEYEPSEIIGTALSSVCHPSDIVPVTRELKDTSTGASVNVVFRIRRKNSGYMWFEGHGSLYTEQGKGRKSIIMVGRERPVYALSKTDILNAGGIGENELWTKMSTSGMFLFVSTNVRQLLDRQPDELVGVSIQSLMRADSKTEFGRILEHARTGKKASVKHEMINRRGQVLSAFTTLYPGDATEGLKPTFIVAQTRLIKFSRGTPSARPSIYPKMERNSSDSMLSTSGQHLSTGTSQGAGGTTPASGASSSHFVNTDGAVATYSGQNGLMIGHQDVSLAAEENLFDELRTTKSSSWQYEIRQLEKRNRMLAEEVQSLIAAKKKRKRRRNNGNATKDCANCHTKVTPEWRRGPSGQRDLCNSCGLRWAKLNGRVSPRTSSQHSGGMSDRASKASASPRNPTGPSTAQSVMKGDLDKTGQSPLHNTTNASAEPKESPKAGKAPEGHAASMEGASGVPAKIEEGVEPTE